MVKCNFLNKMWVHLLQLRSLVICVYDRKKKNNNNNKKSNMHVYFISHIFFSLFTKYKINKIKN